MQYTTTILYYVVHLKTYIIYIYTYLFIDLKYTHTYIYIHMHLFLTTDLFWTCSLKKTARRWMIRFESRCMSLPNLGAVIVNARMVKTKRLPLATLVLSFWFLLEWEWWGYSVFFGKELRVMFTRVVIRVDMPLSSGNVGDPQKAWQSTEEKQLLGLISFSETTSIHLIIPLWKGLSSCQWWNIIVHWLWE